MNQTRQRSNHFLSPKQIHQNPLFFQPNQQLLPKNLWIFPCFPTSDFAKSPTNSPMFCSPVGGPFPGVAMQALSPRPHRWLRKARAWAVATSPQEMLLSGTRMRSSGDFMDISWLSDIWLVVLTIFKNIRQWEGLSHISWKIENV